MEFLNVLIVTRRLRLSDISQLSKMGLSLFRNEIKSLELKTLTDETEVIRAEGT